MRSKFKESDRQAIIECIRLCNGDYVQAVKDIEELGIQRTDGGRIELRDIRNYLYRWKELGATHKQTLSINFKVGYLLGILRLMTEDNDFWRERVEKSIAHIGLKL